METPKIQLDRPEIPDENALRHKDFDKVLSQHAALSTPAVKPWKFWAGGAAVVVVGTFTAILLSSDPDPEQITQLPTPISAEQESAVNPPVDGIDVPYQHYTVPAGVEHTITTDNGTIIHIPADALVDADGNPVLGEVEMDYREFHDPVDFFLSGIPMIYDSAGIEHHFESAGMFEMLATQNAEAVFINPNAPILVELASKQDGDHFNIYQLDTETGDWAYIEKDTAGQQAIPAGDELQAVDQLVAALGPEGAMEKLQAQAEAIDQQIHALEAARPTAPQKGNPAYPKLAVDTDPAEFPEIAIYEGVFWEIGPENDNFDPELQKRNWDDVSIRREENRYLLTFVEGVEEFTFISRPVLGGASYDNAMVAFETLQAEANAALEAKKEAALEKSRQLKHLHDMYLNNSEFGNEAYEQMLRDEANGGAMTSTIVRTFTVSSFGIWNSDCPHKMPKGHQLLATFTDKAEPDSVLYMSKIYLVEKGKNALYTIYNTRFPEFSWNPESENLIWGMDKGTLVVYHYEDFQRLESSWVDVDSLAFRLTRVPQKFNNMMEVKQFMQI